ncbi:conserved hypothetical protein [Sulfolobus islandicus M.14.25]|uniref:Uncharacterized protein n=1 Tax=Saccharolobus islandicus (strain M.14.25 / Kamchatka \|nr:clan AA aspartic protease [Sulfolobus islandicus]ACP37683.1 conserved hypothetical protein [Sulfolobus islandicus M.14.25]
MEIEGEANGVRIRFLIDTGFEGECALSFEIFKEIIGEEFQGIPFESITGEIIHTRAKLIELRIMNRAIKAICYSFEGLDENLLGEEIARKLNLVLDYKQDKIDDP